MWVIVGHRWHLLYKLVAPRTVFGRFFFPPPIQICQLRFVAHNDRLKILHRALARRPSPGFIRVTYGGRRNRARSKRAIRKGEAEIHKQFKSHATASQAISELNLSKADRKEFVGN
jgi:hypothetical protein